MIAAAHAADYRALSSPHEPLPRHRVDMELLGLGLLVILILGAVLFAATRPLLWFLVAAVLFFSGAIGPAFGCVLLGCMVSAVAWRGSD